VLFPFFSSACCCWRRRTLPPRMTHALVHRVGLEWRINRTVSPCYGYKTLNIRGSPEFGRAKVDVLAFLKERLDLSSVEQEAGGPPDRLDLFSLHQDSGHTSLKERYKFEVFRASSTAVNTNPSQFRGRPMVVSPPNLAEGNLFPH